MCTLYYHLRKTRHTFLPKGTDVHIWKTIHQKDWTPFVGHYISMRRSWAFPTVKNYVVCVEFPSASNSIFPIGKQIFLCLEFPCVNSNFTIGKKLFFPIYGNKFWKFQKMKNIIYSFKFKMCSAIFMKITDLIFNSKPWNRT